MITVDPGELMRLHDGAASLFPEPAAGTGTSPQRATALLEMVRREVPFDSAFLAIANPPTHGYFSVTGMDLDPATVRFLSSAEFARDLEITGANCEIPPVSPSDLPFPAEELSTWADYLIPSGIHEGLGIGLFADGRHVGHLAVLFDSRQRPSSFTRRRIERLAPALAQAVDPSVRSWLLPAWSATPPPASCCWPTAIASPYRGWRWMRCWHRPPHS